MKKQILALFMGCVLLCGFSGCGKTSKVTENKTTTTTVSNENLNKDKDDTDYKDIDIKQSEKSDYYTPIEIKNGYDSLQTDDQRKFYDLVLESTNYCKYGKYCPNSSRNQACNYCCKRG